MGWLVSGVLYSSAYALIGWLIRDHADASSWFRAAALFVPPAIGAAVIVRRRETWNGCQWLFWATIALGLMTSAIGLTGWAADELMFGRDTWLAWPSIFALFGGIAPLFALLAQPHRGVREPLAATTAVDIAGLTVVTGFLYSFFVTAPYGGPAGPTSLEVVSELQQAIVAAGLITAWSVARRAPWGETYRRLSLGALVSFATLTLSNLGAQQGCYRSGFVYDFAWILPFAFFPWAASQAPASAQDERADEQEDRDRPRPWVIFTAVALLPFLDFALQRLLPVDADKSFRDLSTAVTLVSVLPLLVARIAAERAELQQAGSTTRLLAQVIEQAQDRIVVFTPDGRCRHANDAFCRAVGLTRDELLRIRASDLMANDTVSADDIQDQVRRSGGWRGNITRRRKDGSTFPVSATVAAILDDDGQPMHVVSVERDISEERRLREQLIHSERLSAIGQLVAGVAHEINNPLQAVMGFAELLIGSETRPDVLLDLEQIRSDADRAAKIVRHLLLFARRSSLERSIADLNEIVRSTVALRTFDLRKAGIELEQAYSDEVPLIVANREEIQQIVLNLVLNAEHAISSLGRPGSIGVRTGCDADSVFVEISDTGPGVSPRVSDRIFEPFFTTKAIGQGTGLGLSVSLGIAQAHGGRLELRPSDRGACFRLILPSAAAMPIELAAATVTA